MQEARTAIMAIGKSFTAGDFIDREHNFAEGLKYIVGLSREKEFFKVLRKPMEQIAEDGLPEPLIVGKDEIYNGTDHSPIKISAQENGLIVIEDTFSSVGSLKPDPIKTRVYIGMDKENHPAIINIEYGTEGDTITAGTPALAGIVVVAMTDRIAQHLSK